MKMITDKEIVREGEWKKSKERDRKNRFFVHERIQNAEGRKKIKQWEENRQKRKKKKRKENTEKEREEEGKEDKKRIRKEAENSEIKTKEEEKEWE